MNTFLSQMCTEVVIRDTGILTDCSVYNSEREWYNIYVCMCVYTSWAWVQHGVVAGSVLQVPINGGPKGILVCQQLHIYSSTSSARYHYFVGFLFCFALFSNIPLYTPQNINDNQH